MKKTLIVVLKVSILTFLFFWIVVIFVDYFRVRQNKNPMFCIKETEHVYDDGTTYVCTGLGYKMFRYNRECIAATEFGPFIIKERTCSND